MEKRDELVKVSIDLYERFNRALTGNEKYKFNSSSERNMNTVNKFICFLEDSFPGAFGKNLIIDYYYFAFGIENKQKTNIWGGKAKVFLPNKIFSKKKFGEFLETSGSKIFYFKQDFSEKGLLIDLETVKDRSNAYQRFVKLLESEEREKSRFYNTRKGYVYCSNFTTLFNGTSGYCKDCTFQKDCKKRLLKNYPKIFKARRQNGAV